MDMRELINLKNTRKLAVDKLTSLAASKHAAMDGGDAAEISAAEKAFKDQQAVVAQLNEKIADNELVIAEQGRFDDNDPNMVTLSEQIEKKKEDFGIRSQLDKVRGSNEYAKAFGKALKSHLTPLGASGSEEFNPLTKALSISGGDPQGEDGGFLVPLDFDKLIIAETKDFFDIGALVNVETVTSNSGWRAVETAAQRTKLPQIDEMGTIGKANQPKFTKVTFNLKQFADRLPVSNPLMQDVPGLMSYLAGWFGPKLILTKNDLILTLLATLDFTPQTAETDAAKVKAIKSILNKGLNTAHSRAASLLTNQTVYDEMDNWVDGNGRAMLVPDLSGDFDRFKNRPVYYADDDEIGTVTGDDAEYNPLYIGNFRKFATIFDRGVLEVAATNIGGDAWATNSTEIRIITRMDAAIVDSSAVKVTGYKIDT